MLYKNGKRGTGQIVNTLQFIYRIISDCPNRVFNGTMEELHKATDKVANWMRTLDIQLWILGLFNLARHRGEVTLSDFIFKLLDIVV